MRKIAVLDKTTIDKIAAGEVVERPSSVVKELVENAIDAGATAVTVEIADGGKKLIRITDNGSGIEASQVQTAFLRHATSKIECAEDLETIASLGFRGEALSSIAAVSQVELITKTPSAIVGTHYIIEGGVEHSLEEMGAPDGTTFLVRNLFFNTPARSKFLHSDSTEANYISTLMEQLALSHPEISFKYIQNKQVKLHTSGNYHVKDVIYQVYGRDIAKALLEVNYENRFMKISGFVGKPEISRGNRTFENYYINGRYIKNRTIAKAIEDAYKGFLMQHKFPFVSLHIEMTGNDLDVNVHPSKMEVRFARVAEVYDAVFQTVRNALTNREMIPHVSVGEREKAMPLKTESTAKKDTPEPFEKSRIRERSAACEDKNVFDKTSDIEKSFSKEEEDLFRGTLKEREREAGISEDKTSEDKISEDKASEYRLAEDRAKETKAIADKAIADKAIADKAIADKAIADKDITDIDIKDIDIKDKTVNEIKTENQAADEKNTVQEKTALKEEQLTFFEEELLSPKSRSRHKMIGQLFDTYWLVEFNDSFYIIDQHAAHEKVNYERLVRQFRKQSIASQYISPPMIVTLNMKEEAVLKENMSFFHGFGFEIEPFGGREYCISAVPATLFGFREEDLFLDMLDHLSGDGKKDTLEIIAERLASMACKAAVKGNHRLSEAEADKLIEELLTLEQPYHCPHGRPTIIAMTKYELEKKFHRVL